MKNKISLTILFSMFHFLGFAQFSVQVNTDIASAKEAYFYTLDGSKYILQGKQNNSNNTFIYQQKKPYTGFMRVYIPSANFSLDFATENKNVLITLKTATPKQFLVTYGDPVSQLMNKVQARQKKEEIILPVLQQIYPFYNPNEDFAVAIKKEASVLSSPLEINSNEHPLVGYYWDTYKKFLLKGQNEPVNPESVVQFITNTSQMLETSSLLRPLLIKFLENTTEDKQTETIDHLLAALDIGSSRGQNVLSELIEIFDAYGLSSLKEKYLNEAKSLKCTVNDRLSNTIAINKSVEIGATFANVNLENTVNTNAKTLYDIKAGKKVVVFWASTCIHCERQLPQLLPLMNSLKQKNIQIVGLSLDNDKESYLDKAKMYPWANASDLRGWNSEYSSKYNVNATPTYFILDAHNKIIAKPDNVQGVINYLKLK